MKFKPQLFPTFWHGVASEYPLLFQMAVKGLLMIGELVIIV